MGNYLPRLCGITTFTTDLVIALSAEAPDTNCLATAMKTYLRDMLIEKVRFEINQNRLSDYSTASEFFNINQIDIVCVQYECGIFCGSAGSYLLKLLGELRMPVVTALHTVLKEPDPECLEVICTLADLSRQINCYELEGC